MVIWVVEDKNSVLVVMKLFLFLFPSGRCLKKNQSAPRPSEHPSVMGEKLFRLVDHSRAVSSFAFVL